MSQPPNGTILAPRARWAASRGEVRSGHRARHRRPTGPFRPHPLKLGIWDGVEPSTQMPGFWGRSRAIRGGGAIGPRAGQPLDLGGRPPRRRSPIRPPARPAGPRSGTGPGGRPGRRWRSSGARCSTSSTALRLANQRSARVRAASAGLQGADLDARRRSARRPGVDRAAAARSPGRMRPVGPRFGRPIRQGAPDRPAAPAGGRTRRPARPTRR